VRTARRAEPGDPKSYRFERGPTKTGHLPLALNDGGEIQAPMGRAIIGVVITPTLLTLVVVLVLYSYLVREKKPRPVPERGGAIPEGVAADRE